MFGRKIRGRFSCLYAEYKIQEEVAPIVSSNLSGSLGSSSPIFDDRDVPRPSVYGVAKPRLVLKRLATKPSFCRRAPSLPL